MTEAHLVGPYVRRFLLEHVVGDRNLSVNTQKSYRDAIRHLLLFMATREGIDPSRLTVEHLAVEVVRSFLAHLEERRTNSTATRNQRLASIHSFLRFVGNQTPELVALVTPVLAIPLRRTGTPVMPYLEKTEIDALLAVPNRRRPQGQRDHALLLFLYNTGARADEAARTTMAALRLDDPPSVRIVGKGRKTRVCPLWPHTAKTLAALLGSRFSGPADAPVFLNVDLEMKAKALATLATCAVSGQGSVTDPSPAWRKDRDLMAFLTSL